MSKESETEQTIHRLGSTLHYWLTGPEVGPLVVFTHGATMDHRMFDEQVPTIVAEGYRVLTWDIRGHGQSKPIGEGFSLEIVTGDLLAILDELGYWETIHVAQSFGGFIAQELTYRHPEIVRILALIGSSSITTPLKKRERLALWLTPMLFKFWPENNFRKLVANNTAVTSEVQEYARSAIDALSKEEFLEVWQGVTRSFREEEDYQIRKPLLLTHGERDQSGNIAKAMPDWASRELNCRYEIVPDAGHNANQDNPEFFNRLLLDFLYHQDHA